MFVTSSADLTSSSLHNRLSSEQILNDILSRRRSYSPYSQTSIDLTRDIKTLTSPKSSKRSRGTLCKVLLGRLISRLRLLSSKDKKTTFGPRGCVERSNSHREYQTLSDDTPPSSKTALGSIVTIFKPERVFTDPPKDLFAKQ